MMKSAFRFVAYAMLIICGDQANIQAVEWIGPVDVYTTESIYSPVVGVDNHANAVILANVSDDLTTYYEEGIQLIQGVPGNIQRYSSLLTNSIFSDNNNVIAVNGNGNAALLWTEYDSDTENDFARAAIFNNNVWGSPTVLSNLITNDVIFYFPLGVTLDSSSEAIAGWINSSESTQTIVNQYTSSSWTGETVVGTSSENIVSLSLAGSPSGQALIFWADNNILYTLKSSYYNGSSWTPYTVSTDLINHCQAPIPSAMNSSNEGIIAWINNSILGVDVALFSNGFSTPQLLYNPGSSTVEDVTVAISDSGQAMVIWIVQDISSIYSVMASHYSGSAWSVPQTVYTASANDSLDHINIGMDKDGNAYAVWQWNPASGNSLVYFLEYTQESDTWSNTPLLLSSEGDSSIGPVLSMNIYGGATVVWTIGSGPQTIQAVYTGNTIPINNPPASVQNLQGKQAKVKFLTQTEYSNNLGWTQSATPTVVSYLVLRNNVQIGVVPATSSSIYNFQDHNQLKGVPVTYSVIAVDANTLQSTAVSIAVP